MTIFVNGPFKFYCYDTTNPIWGTEYCACPSAILSVKEYEQIWLYPEIMLCPDDKILLAGDKELTDNNNIYYYKKIIKNTIQKYKKYLISKKLDRINNDF
jgi:hypothetical protein